MFDIRFIHSQDVNNGSDIIQLMHSFEANIRICQPEKEKVRSTVAKPR